MSAQPTCARAVVLTAALLVVLAVPAWAQDAAPPPPTPVPDVRGPATTIGDAFERVAVQGGQGAWQAADEMFNEALAAMDLHRSVVEAVLGDPARTAFGRIDILTGDLVAALDAEDAPRVRAMVSLIRAELAGIVPEVGGGDTSGARWVETVLGWRTVGSQVLALGAIGSWRDMRNAAGDLTAEIADRGPSVAEAGGPGAQAHVDVARVFSMRLRAAALDQSLADAQAAGDLFDRATAALLATLGAGTRPTATPVADVRMRFRAFRVEAQVGQRIVMPVVADDIPQIALGGFDLLARWSPKALRLVDVTWDVAPGTVQRDDVAGTVALTLPQAPTGPSGSAILARLQFDVRGGTFDPRDYLPRAEIEALETAVRDARTLVRQGDIPKAGRILAGAYTSLDRGRDDVTSLYGVLAKAGLAEALARALLTAVDATSQPVETDAILVTLAGLDARMAATWSTYLVDLAGEDAIPVSLVVRSAADTTGAPLPSLDPIAGQVVLPAGVAGAGPVHPTVPVIAGGVPTPAPVDGSEGLTGTTPTAPLPDHGGTSRSPSRLAGVPLPLLLVLLAAAVLGVVAMLLGDRGGEDAAPPGDAEDV
jgi:hypothetical protein